MARTRGSRYGMRAAVLCYVGVLVVLPLAVVVSRTVGAGWSEFWTAISSAQAVEAFRLTAVVAVSSVAANVVFGVVASILLTRHQFPGRRLLDTLIDLPVSVSPIVVGLALVLVYGPTEGWFGGALSSAGLQVIYAVPGMVLATVFVTLPLVVRELVPVLEEEGRDCEQAATVLGANAWQTFRRITLPTIKWGLAYGIVLSLARAIGEFGAVKVVSGNISGVGQTQTATLLVDERVEQLVPGSYQVATVLMAVAVVAIVVVAVLRPEGNKQ